MKLKKKGIIGKVAGYISTIREFLPGIAIIVLAVGFLFGAILIAVPSLRAELIPWLEEVTITVVPDYAAGAPVTTFISATTVSCHSELLEGNTTDDGNSTIIRRGFVYDTSCEADPGNSTSPEGSTWAYVVSEYGSWHEGTFSLTATTGLSGNTTYFVRTFAFNGTYYGYSACGNFTTSVCPPCDTPVDLTATLVDEYTIHLTWTPQSATGMTVIRMGIDDCPSSALDGVSVYRGTGNSTDYFIATDYIDKDICFRAWDDCTVCATCGNLTYSGNYTSTSVTGGQGMSNLVSAVFFMGLVGLALGLTYYSTKVTLILWRLAPSMAWLALGIWVLLGDVSFLPLSSTWTQVLGFVFIVMTAAPLTLQLVTEVGRSGKGASWSEWTRANPGKSKLSRSAKSQSDYRNHLRGYRRRA